MVDVVLTRVQAGSPPPLLERWAACAAEALPYLVVSGGSVLHDARDSCVVLATVDGRPAGVSRLRPPREATPAFAMIAVPVCARAQGVGSALHRRLVADAVALHGEARAHPPLRCVVEDDERSLAVAARWGLALGRTGRMARVDTGTIGPDVGPLPPGYRVVPTSEVDPRDVWSCFNATTLDDPSGFGFRVTFEAWMRGTWSDPLLRTDLSHVALAPDSRVVALALLEAAGDRGWSPMTGTVAEHRGRGLSVAVKAAALRAAAGAGVRWCGTANDSENAPMVAVNTRLGYTELARVHLAAHAGTAEPR